MIDSYEFLKSILDTVTEHIVVISQQGDILFVNSSWKAFGQNNDCSIDNGWQGVNYLQICDEAAATGDEFGLRAAEGIRDVISTENPIFYFEYPCHSVDEKRWFMMRVTPFTLQDSCCFVISHQNITQRKLAEEELFRQSRIDELTNIANRRSFDEFLKNEWQRCARLKMPVTLAIIDLDHFKLLNDTYGHQAGDECLAKIGAVLKQFSRRPGDLCARYGGEEFSMVFGNTPGEASLPIINKLLDAIRELNIANKNSPVMPIVTASVGLMTMYPDEKTTQQELIAAADRLLYAAKEKGRNRVVHQTDN